MYNSIKAFLTKYIQQWWLHVLGDWLCWSARCSGNSHLQFWLLAVCKNIGRMPGDSYGMICGTGITCCHTYMYSHSWQKTILATKIRQALMENNVRSMKHIWARRNTSKSLPNYMCEISAATKFTEHNQKEAFLICNTCRPSPFIFAYCKQSKTGGYSKHSVVTCLGLVPPC